MKNMGSPNVTSGNSFFYISPLHSNLSVQSKALFKIFQLDHYIVIKVQKHNYLLSPVSLPTFFLSFSAFIWASISSGLVYVLIRPLWPPFLPVSMTKNKNHITKNVYMFQRKSYNLQSPFNVNQGIKNFWLLIIFQFHFNKNEKINQRSCLI